MSSGNVDLHNKYPTKAGFVEKYAVLGSAMKEGFDHPGENTVVFLRYATRAVQKRGEIVIKGVARYFVVSLPHLNYFLAKSHPDDPFGKFAVAGVVSPTEVASIEGPRGTDEALFNLNVHGEAIVINMWEDVEQGAVLGFIAKRMKIPRRVSYGYEIDGRADKIMSTLVATKEAEFCIHYNGKKTPLGSAEVVVVDRDTLVETPRDETTDNKRPFQVVPWCSTEAATPSGDELRYEDEAGETAVGHFVLFGVAVECIRGNAATDIRGARDLIKVDLRIYSDDEAHLSRFETMFEERFPSP